MERIYSTATVCERPGDPDQENCYPLDPGMYSSVLQEVHP